MPPYQAAGGASLQTRHGARLRRSRRILNSILQQSEHILYLDYSILFT